MYLRLIIQLVGGAGALFSFGSIWPYYPAIGSVGTLVALFVAGLGWVVSIDDAIEHATALPTPLDELWKRIVYPVVAQIEEQSR
ncbi:hypothetical protein DJ82_12225 [Halorubrum sp. Ib24]|nr:hypothetical protein DJ82_12225 [Halorubrum sp. Ib24]